MSRRDIYYWKCDRPAAFHGTQSRGETDAKIAHRLRETLRHHFKGKAVELSAGAGQGNHLTWNADVDGTAMFVRVENGPEQDDHLEMESAVLDRVRAIGVPTPKIYGVDASRTKVPFAWQAMERMDCPDLNHWHKQGVLDQPRIAFDIGVAVARWQSIAPRGFGPFDLARWRSDGQIIGYHARYEDYFHLCLAQHLGFLVEKQFLTAEQRTEIEQSIAAHRGLLRIEQGCLVHKDLALWNILGSENRIAAFIDFDDAISGDPTDDLSLLACFHDAAFLRCAFGGYESIRPLPAEHLRRFWLHLLRNIIVKAVIRVGAGYFDRDDGFFLIQRGTSGASLREFTHSRMKLALTGLRNESAIDVL
jgi:aminoglycoside phosphotransferase (APT) family kinase protein